MSVSQYYDLVSRLRSTEYDDLDANKAADEIEFLRATVAKLNEALETVLNENERLKIEADRPGIMWVNEP